MILRVLDLTSLYRKITPNDSKVQSTLSFQQWMEQKDHQRQKEQELEIRRIKETEEIAVKVDPSLAERAYNQYVNMYTAV